jgi:hypothetical protein
VVVSVLGVPLYAYHRQVAVAVLVHQVPAVAAATVRVGSALVPAHNAAHKAKLVTSWAELAGGQSGGIHCKRAAAEACLPGDTKQAPSGFGSCCLSSLDDDAATVTTAVTTAVTAVISSAAAAACSPM